jgi:hypothetical protein
VPSSSVVTTSATNASLSPGEIATIVRATTSANERAPIAVASPAPAMISGTAASASWKGERAGVAEAVAVAEAHERARQAARAGRGGGRWASVVGRQLVVRHQPGLGHGPHGAHDAD